MNCLQAVCDVKPVDECFFGADAIFNPVLQIAAREKLDRDIAVRRREAVIEKLDDVGAVNARDQVRLPRKTLDERRVVDAFEVEYL